ncbi:MAG: hypothetical protein LBQ12_08995, partial [Deltaproteobacteria bacterium]|nr:hypothetical protein [Deltaproteobacteria bacterium]
MATRASAFQAVVDGRLNQMSARITDLRTDMGNLRTDMGDRINRLRMDMGNLRTDMGNLRTDMGDRINRLRTDMGDRFSGTSTRTDVFQDRFQTRLDNVEKMVSDLRTAIVGKEAC